MVFILHRVDDFSLQRELLFANLFQEHLLLKDVSIYLLQLVLGLLLLLVVVLLVLLDELIVFIQTLHHSLNLFSKGLIHRMGRLLQDLIACLLGQTGQLLFEFVVLPANGVQHVMLFDQYPFILLAIFKQTVVFTLQLRKQVVFVDQFGL